MDSAAAGTTLEVVAHGEPPSCMLPDILCRLAELHDIAVHLA